MLLAGPAAALDITGLAIAGIKGGERITFQLSENAESEVSLAEHAPPRVVIDLPSAHWKIKQKFSPTMLVKGVRFGVHDTRTSRIVLDLQEDGHLDNVKMEGSRRKGYRLMFDLTRLSAQEKKNAAQYKPSEKPVIVIDAGHGGQDPGTSGIAGMKEKRITLSFAEALRDTLQATGRYKVVMTRSDDRYLFLRDRVKIARQAKGNLFISLHADSAPSRTARGLSVYTISETASDKEAEALAAKENKADVIGGMDLSATSPDVADILIDLTERETRGKSAQFATLVIRALSREISLLANTHRQAGFAVLKAPDIPSILVEVGFLSSPEEEKQLESETYRRKVAKGLANAIEQYFARRK